MPTNRRGVKLGVFWLVALLAMAPPAFVAGRQAPPPAAYLCPMHPDVVSRTPGSCPRCRMTLVPADPFDSRDFLVDVAMDPPAPVPGARVRLRLTVREPVTRSIVRELVEVHEKPYHLFVISQDLEHYDHVHPVQQPDGSHVVDVTLPRAGFYKLYSDFLPLGGTPQMVPAAIATTGFAGNLASAAVRLVPDAVLARTAGDMHISLTVPPDGLAAGRDEKLHYHIADARSGQPVTDLEPYLAAFGHTLVVSEDTLHYVHAHPVELLPEDPRAARGGPDLTFKALLPRPGRYRLWTQLKRHGVVSTVAFTVDVTSQDSAR